MVSVYFHSIIYDSPIPLLARAFNSEHQVFFSLRSVDDNLTISDRWNSSTNVPYASPRTRISGSWCIPSVRTWPSTDAPKIVDSIMALFRVDYSGRGELSERQQKVVYAIDFG